MERLIGAFEVTYDAGAVEPALTFENIVQGYVAVRLSGADVAQFKGLLEPVRKRIFRFGDAYNVITGAGGDLSIYAVTTGRRLVYLNADETAALTRLLNEAGAGATPV